MRKIHFSSVAFFRFGVSVALIAALSLVASTGQSEEDNLSWSDFEANAVQRDDRPADEELAIEETKTADNDDIEEKIDQPVKVAQKKEGKGVVWGKSAKAARTVEENAAEDKSDKSKKSRMPEKITVRRPVAASKLPTQAESAGKSKPESESADALSEKYVLKSGRKKGSTDLVETLLEVSGDIKQLTNELKAATEKMEVVAGFRYEERIDRFSPSDGPLVGVRQYNLAKGKMKIGDEIKTPELDEALQTIVCSCEKDQVSLFSPKGSLRGEQLLLIEDLPGNTLTLDRLLPNKEVAIGDTWPVPDSVLRSFLSIDAVTENRVEAVLTAVADKMAMIEIVGDVGGVYLGAATEMSVRAKYQFDLGARRINWLGMLIEENRSIGHVGPGLELVARLQVKISALDAPQSLTDDFMKSLDTRSKESVLKLKYDGGKGPWRFSHDRDWYVFQDEAQSTILRKLHRGELVAQCNIADMGKVDLKTMSTLDRFQKELADGLGQSFSKIVSAEEYTNRAGYKVYNVLIDGVVEDLPLRWIYNLLTDKDGRQTVVVFVVEANWLEQFDDADTVLLETFRMGKK